MAFMLSCAKQRKQAVAMHIVFYVWLNERTVRAASTGRLGKDRHVA
jgi:hypothetical protein